MTRKQAIREFKERKTPRGIFAIRSTLANRVWVGASRNLDAAKNGYWFALRLGLHLDKSLQSEWNIHGEQNFAYEVVEKLKDDVHPLELADLLKAKQAEWMERLGAARLL